MIPMKEATNGSIVQDVDRNEDVDGTAGIVYQEKHNDRPCSYNFKSVSCRCYQGIVVAKALQIVNGFGGFSYNNFFTIFCSSQ